MKKVIYALLLQENEILILNTEVIKTVTAYNLQTYQNVKIVKDEKLLSATTMMQAYTAMCHTNIFSVLVHFREITITISH